MKKDAERKGQTKQMRSKEQNKNKHPIKLIQIN